MADADPQSNKKDPDQGDIDPNMAIDPQFVEEVDYSKDDYGRSPTYVLKIINAYADATDRDAQLNVSKEDKPSTLLKDYFDFLFNGFKESESHRKTKNVLTFSLSLILVTVLIYLAWGRFIKVDELINSCLVTDLWLITLPFSQGASLVVLAGTIILLRFTKRIRKRDI